MGCTVGHGSATSSGQVAHGPTEPGGSDRGALIAITWTSQLRRDGRLPSAARRKNTIQSRHGAATVRPVGLEERMAEQLLAMAAEIVSAQVRYNTVATDQLPGLIQQVFNAHVAPSRRRRLTDSGVAET